MSKHFWVGPYHVSVALVVPDVWCRWTVYREPPARMYAASLWVFAVALGWRTV